MLLHENLGPNIFTYEVRRGPGSRLHFFLLFNDVTATKLNVSGPRREYRASESQDLVTASVTGPRDAFSSQLGNPF